MPRQLISRAEVLRRIGKSASTVDRLEKAGRFPRRVRVSSNSIAWFDDEIDEFMANLPRGGIERPEPAIQARAKRRAAETAEAAPTKGRHRDLLTRVLPLCTAGQHDGNYIALPAGTTRR